MMEQELTPQQYEDLQKYLGRLMDESERRVFEATLQQNPVLQGYLQLEQELEQHLGTLTDKQDNIAAIIAETEVTANPEEMTALRRQIQEVSDTWVQQKKMPVASGESTAKSDAERGAQVMQMPKRRPYAWLVAAACVAALLGVWYFWPKPHPGTIDLPVVKNDTPKTKPPDSGLVHNNPIDTGSKKNHPPLVPPAIPPTRLFAENFKPDVLPEDKPGYLVAELDAYNAGDYGPILEKKLDKIPGVRGGGTVNDTAYVRATGRYYQGLAYLQLDNSSKAIAAFTEVRKNAPADSLRRKATWYLAMAYLKKGKGTEAKPLLQQLAADRGAGIYYKKSKEIIKKME